MAATAFRLSDTWGATLVVSTWKTQKKNEDSDVEIGTQQSVLPGFGTCESSWGLLVPDEIGFRGVTSE